MSDPWRSAACLQKRPVREAHGQARREAGCLSVGQWQCLIAAHGRAGREAGCLSVCQRQCLIGAQSWDNSSGFRLRRVRVSALDAAPSVETWSSVGKGNPGDELDCRDCPYDPMA